MAHCSKKLARFMRFERSSRIYSIIHFRGY